MWIERGAQGKHYTRSRGEIFGDVCGAAKPGDKQDEIPGTLEKGKV
jgi:hypothetical protein